MAYLLKRANIFKGWDDNSWKNTIARKRSEYRLKEHRSCTDLRSWSMDEEEHRRWFLERAGHVSTMQSFTPVGKFIPAQMLVDVMTGDMKSQLEDLKYYRALPLTDEQQKMLEDMKAGHVKHDVDDQGEKVKGPALRPEKVTGPEKAKGPAPGPKKAKVPAPSPEKVTGPVPEKAKGPAPGPEKVTGPVPEKITPALKEEPAELLHKPDVTDSPASLMGQEEKIRDDDFEEKEAQEKEKIKSKEVKDIDEMFEDAIEDEEFLTESSTEESLLPAVKETEKVVEAETDETEEKFEDAKEKKEGIEQKVDKTKEEVEEYVGDKVGKEEVGEKEEVGKVKEEGKVEEEGKEEEEEGEEEEIKEEMEEEYKEEEEKVEKEQEKVEEKQEEKMEEKEDKAKVIKEEEDVEVGKDVQKMDIVMGEDYESVPCHCQGNEETCDEVRQRADSLERENLKLREQQAEAESLKEELMNKCEQLTQELEQVERERDRALAAMGSNEELLNAVDPSAWDGQLQALISERDLLQNKVDELSSIAVAYKELESKFKECDAIKEERDLLRMKLQDYLGQDMGMDMLKYRAREAEVLRIERDSLKNKLDELSGVQVALCRALERNQELQKAAAERDHYRKRLEEVPDLETIISSLRAELAEVMVERDQLLLQICRCKDDVIRLGKESDELRKDQQSRKANADGLIANLQKQLAQKDSEMQEMKQRLGLVPTPSDIRCLCEQSDLMTNDLSMKLNNTRQRNQEYISQLKRKQQEIDNLQKHVSQMREELLAYDDLKEHQEIIMQKLKSCEEKNLMLSNELNSRLEKDEGKSSQKDCTCLEGEDEAVTDNLNLLVQIENMANKEYIDSLQEGNKHLKIKLQKAQDTCECLRNELEIRPTREEVTLLEEDLSNLRTKYNELKDSQVKLEQSGKDECNQLKDLRKSLAICEEEKRQALQEKANLEQDLKAYSDCLCIQIDEMGDELMDERLKFQMAKQEIEELKMKSQEELYKKETAENSLREAHECLENIKAALRKCEEEIEKYIPEIKSLQFEVDREKTKNVELQVQLKAYEENTVQRTMENKQHEATAKDLKVCRCNEHLVEEEDQRKLTEDVPKEYQTHTDTSSHEVEQLKEELRKLRNDFNEINDKYKSCHEENKILSAENKRLNDFVTELQKSLDDKVNTITRLQSDLENTEKKFNMEEKTMEELQQKYDAAKESCRCLTLECKRMREMTNKLEGQVSGMSGVISDQREDIQTLTKILQEPDEKSDAEQEFEDALTSSVEAEGHTVFMETLDKESQEKARVLEEQLRDCQESNEQLYQRVKSLEEELSKLVNGIKGTQNEEMINQLVELENIKSEAGSSKESLRKCEESNKLLSDKLNKLEQEFSAMEEKYYTDLEELKTAKELQEKMQQKQVELEKSNKDLTEKLKHLEYVPVGEVKEEGKEEVGKMLKEQLKNLEQKHLETNELLQAKESELNSCKEVNEDLNKTIENMKKRISELSNIDNAHTFVEIQDKDNALTSLKKDYDILKNEKNELVNKLEKLMKERDKCRKEVKELKKKLGMEVHAGNAEASSEDLHKKCKLKLEQLKGDYEKKIQNIMESQKKEIDRIKKDYQDTSEKVKNVKKVEELQKFHDKEMTELRQKYEACKKLLEKDKEKLKKVEKKLEWSDTEIYDLVPQKTKGSLEEPEGSVDLEGSLDSKEDSSDNAIKQILRKILRNGFQELTLSELALLHQNTVSATSVIVMKDDPQASCYASINLGEGPGLQLEQKLRLLASMNELQDKLRQQEEETRNKACTMGIALKKEQLKIAKLKEALQTEKQQNKELHDQVTYQASSINDLEAQREMWVRRSSHNEDKVKKLRDKLLREQKRIKEYEKQLALEREKIRQLKEMPVEEKIQGVISKFSSECICPKVGDLEQVAERDPGMLPGRPKHTTRKIRKEQPQAMAYPPKTQKLQQFICQCMTKCTTRHLK